MMDFTLPVPDGSIVALVSIASAALVESIKRLARYVDAFLPDDIGFPEWTPDLFDSLISALNKAAKFVADLPDRYTKWLVVIVFNVLFFLAASPEPTLAGLGAKAMDYIFSLAAMLGVYKLAREASYLNYFTALDKSSLEE